MVVSLPLSKTRYSSDSILPTRPTIGILNVKDLPVYTEESTEKLQNLKTFTIPNNFNKPILLDYTRLEIAEEDHHLPVQQLEKKYKDRIDTLVKEYLSQINGLFLLGDPKDIPPELFNQEKHPEAKIARPPQRTLFMRRLLRLSTECYITPALNICGSHQQYGVLENMSMHQHLPDVVPHPDDGGIDHCRSDLKHVFVHKITVKPPSPEGGCAFYGILAPKARPPYGPLQIDVNSTHHQGVNFNNLPKSIIVTGLADDNTLESMETKANLPLTSVQFHPETIRRKDLNKKRTLVDRDFEHDDETGKDFLKVDGVKFELPDDPKYYIQQRIIEDLIVKAHAHHAKKWCMRELNELALENPEEPHLSFSQKVLKPLANKENIFIFNR
ncbi:MAG: gamma-glutamyl-gamma-aminobutyrate hydrolase family protein [Alphaproteobacteria bacterium]|nr:gamma-glutamyl-gamma-aminobutyrate hydrolase family protein [Alphaproteobacteria bacterium]